MSNVNRVIALAAVTDDLLDAASRIGVGLPQRAHRDGFTSLVNIEGLVGGVVVQVATAVAARGVAHVQVQRAVAGQVADVGRRTPAPEVAARHRDAHHGDPRGHIGTGWRDVDLGTEAGQGDVDLEQTQVNLEVQRTPGRRRKARTAAEQHTHAGIEVQRAEVNVNLGFAVNLKITF